MRTKEAIQLEIDVIKAIAAANRTSEQKEALKTLTVELSELDGNQTFSYGGVTGVTKGLDKMLKSVISRGGNIDSNGLPDGSIIEIPKSEDCYFKTEEFRGHPFETISATVNGKEKMISISAFYRPIMRNKENPITERANDNIFRDGKQVSVSSMREFVENVCGCRFKVKRVGGFTNKFDDNGKIIEGEYTGANVYKIEELKPM